MKARTHFSLTPWLFLLALFGACVATFEEPPPPDDQTVTEQLVPLPGASEASGAQLETSGPGTLQMSCSSISCNPNTGAGGTAYCRRIIQDQTAWCLRPPSYPGGLCCFP